MAGAVAVGTVERWTGVYNQRGSAPRQLGHALWSLLERLHEGGIGLEELTALMERFGRWEVIAREQGLAAAPAVGDTAPIRVTSSVVDPARIAWVYVVDPPGHRLVVLATRVEDGVPRHRAIATVPLPPAPEPRWLDVEEAA